MHLVRGGGPIHVEENGEMGKDSRKRLPRWPIHISGTKGLGRIGRMLAQGEGKGYLQIVLSERSATSATPSMQIVGGRGSLQNLLLTHLFWTGLACTDSFIEILVGRGEDRKNIPRWETAY